MKHAQLALVCLPALLLLCPGARGISTTESASNPYQGIVDRNIFGLRPPPPPASTEPVKPPPPAVTLTGITTILGKKLAFMNVQIPPKPGEQAKPGPQSFMLGVGEREGEIEVIDIDEKGGTVKLNDYGVVTNVPFAKLPNTPTAPANVAGVPAPHNPGLPGSNPAIPQRSIPGLPTRTLRLGNGTTANGSAGNPGAAINSSEYQSAGGMASTAAPVQNPSRPFSETPLSPEEDAILTEAQREVHRNDPKYPPLPPTPLTSPEDLKAIMAPGSRLPKGFQQMPQ